jgi:hypothetical protein
VVNPGRSCPSSLPLTPSKRGPQFANFRACREAVHHRHLHVHQHQVIGRAACSQHLEGDLRVRCNVDNEALALERHSGDLLVQVVVLHEQEARFHTTTTLVE